MSEELIIRYCSPTLAGIKTANMFNCTYYDLDTLFNTIRMLNRKLSTKSLRIVPLRIGKSTALIYVYRPKKLAHDLQDELACPLLEKHGYECSMPSKCIIRLMERLQDNVHFPHEIGLFLGYPPEDVQGFIDNKAQKCKYKGCWKVYGDEQKARILFARYKKCTDIYTKQHSNGKTIERLTVTM